MFCEVVKLAPEIEKLTEVELKQTRADGTAVMRRVSTVFDRIPSGLRTSFDFSDNGKYEGSAWLGGVSLLGLLTKFDHGYLPQIERPLDACVNCLGGGQFAEKWDRLKSQFRASVEDGGDRNYTLLDAAEQLEWLVELAEKARTLQTQQKCSLSRDPLLLLLLIELVADSLFVPGGEVVWVEATRAMSEKNLLQKEQLILQRYQNKGIMLAANVKS